MRTRTSSTHPRHAGRTATGPGPLTREGSGPLVCSHPARRDRMNLHSVWLMNHTPRIRTVVSCTLLVVSLGAGATACGGLRRQSARRPSRTTRPTRSPSTRPPATTKVDPDKPLEVTAKGDDGRITDVTVVDTAGRHLAGELAADGNRWRSTPRWPPAPATPSGSPRRTTTAPRAAVRSPSTTAPAKKLLKVTFGPQGGHVRRRPAHHRRTQRSGQGQGRQGRRRARPEGPLHARRGGRLVLGGRQEPALPPEGVLARRRHRRASAATSRASRSPTSSTAAPPSR